MGIKAHGHSKNPELAVDLAQHTTSFTRHRFHFLPSNSCLGLSSGLFLSHFPTKISKTVFKSKKVWCYVTTL